MSTTSESTRRPFSRRALCGFSFPFKAFVAVGWPFYWMLAAVAVALLDTGAAVNYKHVVLPVIWNTADVITSLYAVSAVSLLALGAVEVILRFQVRESRTFLFFLIAVIGILLGSRGHVVT